MIGLMTFRAKAIEHLAAKEKSSQYDKLAAQNAELVQRIQNLERKAPHKRNA